MEMPSLLWGWRRAFGAGIRTLPLTGLYSMLKNSAGRRRTATRAKAQINFQRLTRPPKGPLFHGSTDKPEFFSKLFSP